jgi:hypothetical protein
MENKTKRFELLMTPTARIALDNIERKQGVSCGQAIENLIRKTAKREKVWPQ